MTKKDDDKDFHYSGKCWIYDNDYVDGDVKVRDHCHISRKYGDIAHRDDSIKVKLNHKTSILFHILKNCEHILLRKN